MKQILILTDSLSLPRSEPEYCLLEETWPLLLERSGYEIIHVAIGGATCKELLLQLAYYSSVKVDMLIIQLGIVDAAPRVMTKEEQVVVNYFWIARKLVLPFLIKYKVFFRKTRKITFTKDLEFKSTVNNIKNYFNAIPVYALGILPPSMEYEYKVPGIEKNVNRYNYLLREVFGDYFISNDDFPKDGIMSDHHHLNRIGHQHIFIRLLNTIRK